jgi:hypothetical protein
MAVTGGLSWSLSNQGKGYHPIMAQLSQYKKYIKTPSSKRWRDTVNWGY